MLTLYKGKPLPSGEFTSQKVVMRSVDAFCHVSLNKLLNKPSSCWWFEIWWCSRGVNVIWVLGFGYCVKVACSRIFMGVAVENNLIVQCASATAIFMRAGYWPWLHTIICFVGAWDSIIWYGLSSTWNILFHHLLYQMSCGQSAQPN